MEKIKVLMVTSEWPTNDHPNWVPFLVQQVDYLRKAGVDVEVFSFRGSKNPLNYFRAWSKVRKKLRVIHYDLIHAQFGQSGLLGIPKSIPFVVTFHGSDLQGDVKASGVYSIRGRLLQFVSKLVALFADEIIVVSPMLRYLIGFRKNSHVIPCGLNLDLFKPMDQIVARHILNFPVDGNYILFGGRPEMPVKRYQLAKQAVSLLKMENVKMIAVNDVSHDQMPLYLNACNVLLLTSLHEGSPTIIKEALACNLPIVSLDVGDVRQRIEGIGGCIICDNDVAETIAADLEKVLCTNERTNGRQTVIDLDESILVDKLISVYKMALGRK